MWWNIIEEWCYESWDFNKLKENVLVQKCKGRDDAWC